MVNKGFISYPLLINGECVDTIIPKSAEWQVCDLSSKDQKVYLKEGNNTITVIGTQKDIPEVALVLQPTEKDNFKTNYNNYIEDLKSNIKEKVVKNKRSVDSYIHWNPDLSSFPHDYEYRLSEPIRYSFNDSYMLNMGDTIDFYIESVGHSDFTAYFFCRDNPDDYSWFEASDYGECFIHKVIPQSGVYYLYIKGLDGAGICNVTVDSSVTYENMPFNNGEIYCIQDTRYKYNTFTCHLSNDNCYPLVLVKDQHERIVGFAGEIDYSYGDFNWGHNARINKNYRSPTESVIVTASTPYPLGSTGDIYIRCKNLENTWIYTHHPNLKSEDAIVSSEPSSQYNCIAWSIGIWEDSFDLTDNNQELVNEIGGRQICEDFYSDAGYIPTENPNESVIDVWSTSEIEIDAGHASVRKHLQQNPIAHGYDWESKMGSLERIFHPRFALEDTLGHYGHVAAYFKPNPYLGVRSMSERVADDEVVLENNQFTVGEIEYIMDKSKNINYDIVNQFFLLYTIWKESCNPMFHCSTKKYTYCQEYESLLFFCKKHIEVKYFIFQMVNNDDLLSIQLMKDLLIPIYVDIWNNRCIYNKTHKRLMNGALILRSTRDIGKSFARKIINKEMDLYGKSSNLTDGIFYSDSNSFN